MSFSIVEKSPQKEYRESVILNQEELLIKTKFISLILVIAICITVGGVYAAWLYAETPMTSVHGHIGSFGLATAVVNNAKGTIEVNGANAHLTLDQTAADDYTAELKASGDVVITFTPSEVFANSNKDMTEIVMDYKLVTSGDPANFKCDDGSGEKLLFKTFDIDTVKQVTLRKQGNVYIGAVSAQSLLDDGFIEVNEFVLDTIEKHTAFSTKIGTFGNIGIEVSENHP